MRPLAVTSKTRFAELPNVPTVAESGYPSYDFVVWYAFVAPAGTPVTVVSRLNAAMVQAVRPAGNQPLPERLGAGGGEGGGMIRMAHDLSPHRAFSGVTMVLATGCFALRWR